MRHSHKYTTKADLEKRIAAIEDEIEDLRSEIGALESEQTELEDQLANFAEEEAPAFQARIRRLRELPLTGAQSERLAEMETAPVDAKAERALLEIEICHFWEALVERPVGAN